HCVQIWWSVTVHCIICSKDCAQSLGSGVATADKELHFCCASCCCDARGHWKMPATLSPWWSSVQTQQ
ncbi:hypothetical protein LEMLEM_LOCUS9890, partial [Lemmus lemmus]